MDKHTLSIITELSKRMRVMIVDSDENRLQSYKTLLDPLFIEVFGIGLARDAYIKWRSDRDRYDLLILTISDQDLGNIELFKQIRKKSYEQKIIVAFIGKDYNDLHEIITKGIDGIITGPSDENTLMEIFQRLLRDISDRKLLHSYITQLSIMAKDNADLRVKARNLIATAEAIKETLPAAAEFTEEIKNTSLVDKYAIRTSFKTSTMARAVREMDIFSMERIDMFREKIHLYHQDLIDLDIADNQATKATIIKTTDGLLKIIEVINDLGLFPVTVQAALHMSTFLKEIDPNVFEDAEKKNLVIDITVGLFDDLEKWIDTVFIKQDLEFVNYFDASFANTCLELEAAFNSESSSSDDDDALEFF